MNNVQLYSLLEGPCAKASGLCASNQLTLHITLLFSQHQHAIGDTTHENLWVKELQVCFVFFCCFWQLVRKHYAIGSLTHFVVCQLFTYLRCFVYFSFPVLNNGSKVLPPLNLLKERRWVSSNAAIH